VKQLEEDLLHAHSVVEAGKAMLTAFQTGKAGFVPAATSTTTTTAVPPPPTTVIMYASAAGQVGKGGVSGDTATSTGTSDSSTTTTASEGVGGHGSGSGSGGTSTTISGFGVADRMLQAIQSQRDRFKRDSRARESELALVKR